MVKLRTAHADVCSTTAHGFMWLNPRTAKYEEVSPIQLQEREHASIITANRFNYTAPLVDKIFGQDVTTDFVYWLKTEQLVDKWQPCSALPPRKHANEPQPTSNRRGSGTTARASGRRSRHRRVAVWPGGKTEPVVSTSTRSPGRGQWGRQRDRNASSGESR